MQKEKNLKVALVHDYLNQYGGGERVLEALYEMFPEATVYTSIYDRELMEPWLKIPPEKIKTNFINRLPFHNYLSKHYFFLYPLAFRLQNVGEVDLVISTCSYASKFIRAPKGAVHICYLHTVPRFLWGYDTELSRYYKHWWDRFLAPLYAVVVPIIKYFLKRNDFAAAQKIDYLLVDSKEVQARVKKHYRRDSVVIYPPVDVERFQKSELTSQKDKDYYIIISRLGGYKKVDLAVAAFNKLGKRLKIVGEGPQREYLKKIAAPNVELLGRLSDPAVNELLINAKALVFPTFEDFGIVPVEAMAAGVPVIAYGKGGAAETVVDGKTGLFFAEQTSTAIIEAIKKFETLNLDPKDCIARAREFSKDKFQGKIEEFINREAF
ncbi:MAG TPA: glycosyltransferase [Candidatus Saccharimonadales bacterium]|nr:glycosyltransferase [Candidatus Saccharimonadales bacterium]